MARRTLLGTKNSLSVRTRIYLAGDALEVDDIEGYSGARSRVLLDEVRLITIDRRRSTSLLVGLGILAMLLFSVVAFSLPPNSDSGAAGVVLAALLISSPLFLSFAIHAFFGVDHVTIFGKRSNAAMTFTFRKAKARRTFEMLREKVAQTQEEARARFAEEAALQLPVAPVDFGGQTG